MADVVAETPDAEDKIPKKQQPIENLDLLDEGLKRIVRQHEAIFLKIQPIIIEEPDVRTRRPTYVTGGYRLFLANPKTNKKTELALLNGDSSRHAQTLRDVVIDLSYVPLPRETHTLTVKYVPKIDRSQPLTHDDIPPSFIAIAKVAGVEFKGPPEWVKDEQYDQQVFVRAIDSPGEYMPYRYDVRRIESHATNENFRILAERVAEASKPDDSPKARPYIPFEVPAVFREIAARTKAAIDGAAVRTEHQQGKVTLIPVAVTVQINGQTKTFKGDEVGRGWSFVFKGGDSADASEAEQRRFEDTCLEVTRLATQQKLESLQLETRTSFAGKTSYGADARGVLGAFSPRLPQASVTEPSEPVSRAPQEELPSEFQEVARRTGVIIGIITHERELGKLHKMDISEADGITVTAGIDADEKTFVCDGGLITRSFAFDKERSTGEFSRFETFARTLVADAEAARKERAQWLIEHRQGDQHMRQITKPSLPAQMLAADKDGQLTLAF